ncbi:putative toxin-antitoxin system toxin component, PIN family [Dyadobacter bucti]|uniref:putative toxin-antitoxin system toxin component, PIN family n=1 Tax=Dyadobacter bucti TaxID=2572203 RepID=UPI0035B5E259
MSDGKPEIKSNTTSKKQFCSFNPVISVSDCRDQKDNMILELALTYNASCIISGDFDLLVLQPFRSIQIVSPSDFVNNYPPAATKV